MAGYSMVTWNELPRDLPPFQGLPAVLLCPFSWECFGAVWAQRDREEPGRVAGKVGSQCLGAFLRGEGWEAFPVGWGGTGMGTGMGATGVQGYGVWGYGVWGYGMLGFLGYCWDGWDVIPGIGDG